MPTASAGISNGEEPLSRQCNEDDREAKRAEKAKFQGFSLFCPLRLTCLSDSYTGTAPRALAGGRARDRPPADARAAPSSHFLAQGTPFKEKAPGAVLAPP